MKALFDHLSARMSKATTHTYSTSFSLGIYLLNRRLRNSVYSVYGFVRLADEIVDSFEGYDKKYLLAKFSGDTFEAIETGISVNPVLNSFQHAVRQYNIDYQLIETFLKSMEMDLDKVNYTREKYQQYILGSAESVGLMCLYIFAEGDTQMFEELKPYAMKLGAAFQKVNFLRDMKNDYEILGRTYFPNVKMPGLSRNIKQQIEDEIGQDFKTGLAGIKKLPSSSRGGVYLAYLYYQALFEKIKKLSAQNVLDERIRINNGRKFSLLINSVLQQKLNLI